LSERLPLAEGSAPVLIPEIVLEVKLDDLLNKRFFVENLRIVSPEVTEAQDAAGRSTLESLFQRPQSVDEVPRAIPVSATAPVTESPQIRPEENSDPGFAFAVSTANIEGGRLTITNPKVTVAISDLDFALSGIDVDPKNLQNHNLINATLSTHIQVSGVARIGGVMRPTEMANLKLAGEAKITPINPVTGKWSPMTVLKLTLDRGSVLAGHLTMGDAAGKEMKKLIEYGVDLSPVKIGGALQEPAVLQGLFENNRFSLKGNTRFAFPEYEVMIEGDSWFNSAQDQHEMDLRLSCGAGLQARLQQGVSQARLGESIARGVIKALSDDRGRMTFDIESDGALSDPKIKPRLDRLLKNLIRGEGLGDLLQGLLKKL